MIFFIITINSLLEEFSAFTYSGEVEKSAIGDGSVKSIYEYALSTAREKYNHQQFRGPTNYHSEDDVVVGFFNFWEVKPRDLSETPDR